MAKKSSYAEFAKAVPNGQKLIDEALASSKRQTRPAGGRTACAVRRIAFRTFEDHPRKPTVMDAYIRAVNFLSQCRRRVSRHCSSALAVLVICDMVFVRYRAQSRTPSGRLDVVTYSLVAATFVGSAYVLMTHGHVNVEILPLISSASARVTGSRWVDAVGDWPFASLLWVLCTHYLVSGLVGRLALEHGLARAPVDSLCWRCRSGSGMLSLQYVAELLAWSPAARIRSV